MKFGKLEHVDHVDFSMSADPVRTQGLLANLDPKEASPKLYYGCTGWSMKEWVGGYYPKGTKSGNYLDEYAKQFNTIELNTTYYRIPSESLIQKWVDKTPTGFRFSPKIPQIISHSKDLALGKGHTKHFCEVIQGLGQRLGTSFLQLPPHFGPQQLPLLDQFLAQFPLKQVPLAVEVRHQAWLNEAAAMKELYDLLAHYEAGTVFSDVAGRRDALHLELTTPEAMIRFVGNDLHESDYQRVDAWCERLKSWFEQGLETAYFFHHQPENIRAPEMTTYFVEQMNAVCDWNLAVPKPHEDRQLTLF